jgi:hypothetical protein
MKGSPVRIRASASLNRAASRTEQARLRALESSVDRIWTAFGQRRARSQSPWKTEKSNPNAPVAKQTITSAPTQRPTNGPTPIVGAMSKEISAMNPPDHNEGGGAEELSLCVSGSAVSSSSGGIGLFVAFIVEVILVVVIDASFT